MSNYERRAIMWMIGIVIIMAGIIISLSTITARAANPTELYWTAPTTNDDGTPLTDLAGYRLYCGNATGTYTAIVDTGMTTVYPLSSIVGISGTYYCIVKALDITGNESKPSNEVSFLYDTVGPGAPAGLGVR